MEELYTLTDKGIEALITETGKMYLLLRALNLEGTCTFEQIEKKWIPYYASDFLTEVINSSINQEYVVRTVKNKQLL
jgi:hypothetical protein